MPTAPTHGTQPQQTQNRLRLLRWHFCVRRVSYHHTPATPARDRNYVEPIMPTTSLTGRLPNQWAGRAYRLGPIASRAVDFWDARNPRTTTQQKTKSKRLPGPGGSNEPTVAPPPLRKQLETNYYHKNNAHPNLQKTTADSKNTPDPQPQIRAWPSGVLLVISTLLGATAAAVWSGLV